MASALRRRSRDAEVVMSLSRDAEAITKIARDGAIDDASNEEDEARDNGAAEVHQ